VAALPNEGLIMKGVTLGVFDEIANRILFGKPSRERDESLWNDLRIKFLYCENSAWACFYASERGKEKFAEAWGEKNHQMIPGANHFVRACPFFYLDNILMIHKVLWENSEVFVQSVLKLF
jgi:hypothetical protein